MIFILYALYLLPLVYLMVQNGRQGNGYKIVIKRPDTSTRYGLLKLIGFTLYTLFGVALVVFGHYYSLGDEGYVGITRIVLTIVSIMSIALVLYVYRKNK